MHEFASTACAHVLLDVTCNRCDLDKETSLVKNLHREKNFQTLFSRYGGEADVVNVMDWKVVKAALGHH